MILDEIASYVAANSTMVVGTDLFKAAFPADGPDTATAFYETGGLGVQYNLGNTVGFERPALQVISRSTRYTVARNRAQVVYNLITGLANSTEAITTDALQSPFSIGTDDDRRYMVSCNYIVTKGLSST